MEGSRASSDGSRIRPETAVVTAAPSIPDALANPHVLVDLSVPLGVGLPCTWPGHAPFSSALHADFSTGQPYRTSTISMDEHAGTHVDAPCHSIHGDAARTVATIPLDELIGPAAVIDAPSQEVQAAPGRSPRVSAEAVQAFEAMHGPIEAGDVVLLRTGWDRRYAPLPDGRAYVEGPMHGMPGWPAPDPSFLELLLQRGVRCLGTDAPSVGALDDPGPAHVISLANGLWPIEALANLSALPSRGAFFVFLPLSISGSGAPGRAVAFVPNKAPA